MAEARILTVSQLSELIRMLIDGSPLLRQVTVKGEISNLTVHRTGHLYFSLKDESAVIRAVMFRSAAEKLRFAPENGLKVLARGKVTVYPAGGSYQIAVDDLQPDGIGALQLAFEQLKRRLNAEGLFDPARKRQIPKIPRTVGVITSPTGAAIRDILNISARRFPYAKVIVYPAAVQGDAAPSQLREGVMAMANDIRPDLIIIGRGGGSAEDLWAFNDEALVRAVAACPIPIISAVGHEIDFTLCDFAADLRAPTPSAAAELAFPDTGELIRRFGNVSTKMEGLLGARIGGYRQMLERLAQSRAMQAPEQLVRDRKEALSRTRERMLRAMRKELDQKTMHLASRAALLDALSPLKVLARGYAAVRTADGRTIREALELSVGDAVTIQMHGGRVGATVDSVIRDKRDERTEGEGS